MTCFIGGEMERVVFFSTSLQQKIKYASEKKNAAVGSACNVTLDVPVSTVDGRNPCGVPSDRFPPRDVNLSNLPHNRGLFKKQLGAYTKQFAGSLTPLTLAVERGPFSADLSHCRLHKAT